MIRKGRLCNLSEDRQIVALHNARMPPRATNKADNHLRAWREYRRMTQEELAKKVETTGAVISLLESGDRQLSPKWLRKLAPALGTRPGFLLDFDPHDVNNEYFDAAMSVPESDRPRVLRVLRAMKTGTDD